MSEGGGDDERRDDEREGDEREREKEGRREDREASDAPSEGAGGSPAGAPPGEPRAEASAGATEQEHGAKVIPITAAREAHDARRSNPPPAPAPAASGPTLGGFAAEFLRRKHEVLGALRDVAEIASSSGAHSIAKKLRDERIPRLDEERFHLVVLGEFNHGKTTFVNALLGASVLPMGVTPTTAVIHHILHAERPSARAVREDGSETVVAFDALDSYDADGSADRANVRYLEVRYPAPLLRDRVVLVDTPGVNDLNLSRAEITYSYVPRADAVIFLLDAGQILKESERAFLEEKLLAQSRDKILFVINKIDLLTDDEREQAVSYAKNHLAKIVKSPRVYTLSSEMALAGDPKGSGLEAFLEEAGRYLANERGSILLENALGEGLRASMTLRQAIELKRRALALATVDIDARIARLEAELEGRAGTIADRQQRVREQVAEIKVRARHRIELFSERLLRTLPAEIDKATSDDLKRFLPGFVQESFKTFAEGLGREVTDDLEKLAEETIALLQEDARDRTTRIADALGAASPDLTIKVDTFAYDVSVFALGAAGIGVLTMVNVAVGGAMLLATPILAVVLRGQAEKETRKRAKEALPAAVQAATQRMTQTFDDAIDELGRRLVDFVANVGEELTRSVMELLREARTARERGEQALVRAEAETGSLAVRVAEVDERLQGLRKSLLEKPEDATTG
ncbi:MAG: dynamin family protein [Deltaproteobacteria bacterium]|nr:dynamin family protein [Deltaproteobacteria bacterium]